LLVGADDRENNWIGEALAEHAAISMSPRARGLSVVNTDVMSVGTREKLYAQGGIFSITSRILVVDLLTNLLNPETITGVVVLHADKVVATSLEAFILRIYRQKNKTGFLKAFSDAPEPFTTGFAPLTTMMRNLFLRQVALWPRFQVTVAQSLEGKKKAEVIELEVPMSQSMQDIQRAILECVEVSIGELKKGNTGLEMGDWNVDGALHKQFDVVVRRQLDPVWHRISWKTKQIVHDLTVLRSMLRHLVTYDAVSFNKHLDTILAAHSPPPGSTKQNQSPWLFLDAAHTLFDTAKRRVYTGKVTKDASQNIDSLRPVLEEQPKWAVLAEVMEEIDRDLYFSPQLRDDSNGTILIMCSDAGQCRQLREYLQNMHVRPEEVDENMENDAGEEDEDNEPSATFMMRRKLRDYLKWKEEFKLISATLFAEAQNGPNGNTTNVRGGPSSFRGKAPPNKRRRVRGGGSVGVAPTRATNGSILASEDKPSEVADLLTEIQPTEVEAALKDEIAADPLEDMEDYYKLYDTQDLVVIHAFDGDMDEHILEEVKPRYIIMYEPDVAFVRRIEVYRSSHNDRNVRVYFLSYKDSVEEQRYLSSVRREKDAFSRLIKEKSQMAITITTDAHGVEDPQEAFLRTINTRIAGGGRIAATAQPPRVVVDVREFRSSLPSLLHGRNIIIVPCMLTVGDYVLSPTICVERKSIKDLISSFKDGRLYNQTETMFQHYKNPMLLIEFNENKSFTLEPFADLSGSLSSTSSTPNASSDLQSKLVLLTLAFPKLRIIWSSSPYQTAEIFASLKTQEAEPDPIAAVRMGLDGGEVGEQAFNRVPQDMLRLVPGVTSRNVQQLIRGAGSLKEVSNMSVTELGPLIGAEAGRKVWGFFNRSVLE
jgi:DNA excision repair protein ERCC-4